MGPGLTATRKGEGMAKEKTVEQRIVEAIIFDLSDRRGLSGEWDMIDDDIKKQIRAAWREIVRREIDRKP
jgi:hypothetical protein